jgi:DNA-binding response OmpR family regulator
MARNLLLKKKELIMGNNSSISSKKILVVDDDRDIREIIMMVLESEGFEVAGLDNGTAVIDTVQQFWPDLVLLDVQLGDRDGRDICRDLKGQPATRAIPVIIISASHGWHALRKKHCEADDFLAKPFDITELVDQVKRYAA